MNRTRLATTFCLLATAGFGGCLDAPTEPSALVIARETQAALQISEELPTVWRIAERVLGPDHVHEGASSGLGGERGKAGASGGPAREGLRIAAMLWLDGEAAAGEEGRILRARSYRSGALALAEHGSAEILDMAIQDTEAWIGLARAVLLPGDPLQLANALEEGAALVSVAREASGVGDVAAAYEAIFEAADVLRETTPRSVAARLLLRGEESLARRAPRGVDRHPPPASPRRVDLARAQRLLDYAREAMKDGDYPLAIRRAYYAGRILDQIEEPARE